MGNEVATLWPCGGPLPCFVEAIYTFQNLSETSRCNHVYQNNNLVRQLPTFTPNNLFCFGKDVHAVGKLYLD